MIMKVIFWKVSIPKSKVEMPCLNIAIKLLMTVMLYLILQIPMDWRRKAWEQSFPIKYAILHMYLLWLIRDQKRKSWSWLDMVEEKFLDIVHIHLKKWKTISLTQLNVFHSLVKFSKYLLWNLKRYC